jgi:hypothetical protein
MKKTWIKIKRGFLQPKHRTKMGVRVWLYMYIVDQADWDTGIVYDWTDKNAAEELGMPINTLRQQRQELEELRYINCIQKGNHQEIVILKWVDPRSYSGEILNNIDEGEVESKVKSEVEGTEITSPLHSTHIPLIINQESLSAKNPRAEPEYEPFDQQADMPESMAHEYDPPKKTRKPKKQPDPRYTHPAYMSFYRLTKRRPPGILVDDLINTLGNNVDEKKLENCLKEWVKRGFNPNNLSWALEWYKNGIPGYSKKKTQDDSSDIIQRALERAHNGNG